MRKQLSAFVDAVAQPLLYGARLWLDCLFGYRPTPEDDPDFIA